MGRGIPRHITGLPAEVLATPFGQALAPMLSGLEAQLRGVRQQAYAPPPPAAAAGGAPAGGAGAAPAPHAEAPAAAATTAGQGGVDASALVAAETELEAVIAGEMVREVEGLSVRGEEPGSGDAAAEAAAPPAPPQQQQQAQQKLAVEGAVRDECARLVASGA